MIKIKCLMKYRDGFERTSRKEICFRRVIFVVVSFCFLSASGLWLTHSDILTVENRKASSFPSFFNPTGINEDFSPEFEKWLQDHLGFRMSFVLFYNQLHDLFQKQHTKQVLFGKDDWLFRNSFGNSQNFHNLKAYQNAIDLTSEQKKKIVSNFNYIADFAKKHGIRVYVIIPPDKARIYPEYVPSFVKRLKRPAIDDQLLFLPLPQEISFLLLEREMLDFKKKSEEPLFYKTDTHWTHTGAFGAYQRLMRDMQKHFPNLIMRSEKDYDFFFSEDVFDNSGAKTGNLWAMLPGHEKREAVSYLYFKFKQNVSVSTEGKGIFRSSFPGGNNLKAYIFNDSFGLALNVFLRQTFKETKSVRFNEPGTQWGVRFQEREKDILDFGADIIIFEISDLKIIEMPRLL